MDNTYPAGAWRRLGKELERRRGQFGYGFRQRGTFLRDRGGTMSEKTLARLERGERDGYPDATIAAVEALYGWMPGSAEAVLKGGEPSLSPGTPGAAAPGPQYADADLQRVWDASKGAPEDKRREIIELARRMRDSHEHGNGAERSA